MTSAPSRRSVLKIEAAASGLMRRRARVATPVVAAFGSMDLTYFPNIVALEKRFAAQNGLALKLRITEGRPPARTMVAAGEADLGHGDTTLPLQLVAKSVGTKVLGKREMVAAYIKSLLQALQWLKTASNDDVVSVVWAKYLPNNDPAAIAFGMDFHRKTTNFSGQIDPAQYARASAVWFRRSTGMAPVAYADAIDRSILA